MFAMLADENFRGQIVSALKQRCPELDIVRVQEIGLAGEDDDTILAWAAAQKRVLLTHDRKSMICQVGDRSRNELPFAGVVIVRNRLLTIRAVEDILIAWECSMPDDWQGRILFVPF